jgi:hypothetical protein
MDNVVVLPGSKELATAPDEKTVDIHVFLLSLGQYLCWWTISS